MGAVNRKEDGFKWIQFQSLRIYSCCWFPNTLLANYVDFFCRLEHSIRNLGVLCVVTGDFYAHSTEWGSSVEDNRGKNLADLMDSLGVIVGNHGDKPTFVRNQFRTHIYVTFVAFVDNYRLTEWDVLSKESLSLHKYIFFDISLETQP